ncbi:hypothetical protein [Aquitalea sp. ASV11]|jgi:hypothetical protein|uniref:hypothetical protein n=1 Tax=Aquitalea sp. ASV11 TaxID=2795103 RepID=UPI0018ED1EF0|nr:hypothetical protein [Aquitalea sp. ASV11]
MHEEKLITVLEQLVEKLDKPQQAIPFDKQIWDEAQCAAYMGVSKRQFAERISADPHFPPVYNISAGSGVRRDSRYKACEVVRWVESRKIRRPAC